MSITDIQNKIIADAEREAEHIAERANMEVNTISADTQVQKDALSKEHEIAVERASQHIEHTTLSEARQTAKRTLEKAQQDILDDVFTRALTTLIELPADEYEKLITTYLEAVPTDTEGTVSFPEKREKETKSALKKCKHTKLDPAPSKDIAGGFIIDGTSAHYNYSFAQVVNEIRRTHTIDIAQRLFKA